MAAAVVLLLSLLLLLLSLSGTTLELHGSSVVCMHLGVRPTAPGARVVDHQQNPPLAPHACPYFTLPLVWVCQLYVAHPFLDRAANKSRTLCFLPQKHRAKCEGNDIGIGLVVAPVSSEGPMNPILCLLCAAPRQEHLSAYTVSRRLPLGH
jgi:hypothetical protein